MKQQATVTTTTASYSEQAEALARLLEDSSLPDGIRDSLEQRIDIFWVEATGKIIPSHPKVVRATWELLHTLLSDAEVLVSQE